jgi:broad specificity phosphatase PhoE|tara:strand:+ start:136 stop:702 length:567 start_codon:yes stop_codon:yes gene_type:complete
MTLFLLRHEKRFSEPTFFTSLTDEGLKDSELLTEKFNEIKPDIILCSPFLRCIQTIYPYISQSDKKINIEYSLYEFMDNPIFTNKNYKHQVSELYNKYPKFKKIINEDYMSYLTSEQIIFPQNTTSELNKRLIPFVKHLIRTYENTDIKILLVSHMGIVSSIKEIILTGSGPGNIPQFNMGHIERLTL